MRNTTISVIVTAAMSSSRNRPVVVPNGYISPDMKFFPLAIPVIIVRSSVRRGNIHFNKVDIDDDYGYYNDIENNSKKFKKALMKKFRDRLPPCYHVGERLWYVDELKIQDEKKIYPPYIDRGFSSVDEFIEYNAKRIYDGTVELYKYLQRLCPDAFKK